jgi:hypothetical protein
MRVANIVTTNESLPERNFLFKAFIIPNKFHHLDEIETINFYDINSRTIFAHGLISRIVSPEEKEGLIKSCKLHLKPRLGHFNKKYDRTDKELIKIHLIIEN